jgi:predicted ArsR family transcriptional regulator
LVSPEVPVTATHHLGPTRARVLALLQGAGTALSAPQVSERLGLHANSVRFHLDALVADGFAVRRPEERSSPGRPKLLYTASPAAPDVADRRYGMLAAMLGDLVHEHVAEPAELGERVGRSWARRLALQEAPRTDEGGHHPRHAVEPEGGLATLVATLGAVGFDSRVADDVEGLRVEIRPCPFLEVAAEHPDVVCPLHLGLMRGVLERIGSELSVASLEPFAASGLCQAPLVH